MSFWIKKYAIELERLPISLLIKGILVVFLCLGILSAILLLLPIQDTIKGDVVIYTKGQPLSLNAPSSGFLHFVKNEEQIISKGDLIATIDVEISQSSFDALSNLVFKDLMQVDMENTQALITSIQNLATKDFREINNELFTLVNLIRQLDVLKTASDPSELISTLERSIAAKERRAQSFDQLNAAHNDILGLIKEQLRTDSLLWISGGLSEREFRNQQKNYIDKQSILIENNLRKQEITGDIIQDEKEKFALSQEHRSRIEELRLSIVDQLKVIRQKYQIFVDQHVILSPINGMATLPHNVVDQEYINEGQPMMQLSFNNQEESTTSEMYIIAQNAGKIKPGMDVRIGLSEFDQKEFGIYYTTISEISELPQDGKYKLLLETKLPLKTSYEVELPNRDTYNGEGEILIGKINLLTKISREIQYNKTKYASL